MDRLFVQYLAIYETEDLQYSIKFGQCWLKNYPNVKWTLQNFPKTFNFLPKWRNFSKYGHTGLWCFKWIFILPKSFKIGTFSDQNVTRNVVEMDFEAQQFFVLSGLLRESQMDCCRSCLFPEWSASEAAKNPFQMKINFLFG